MKYSRAASWFTRVAVLFLLMSIGLLFTAAAIELKHAPHRSDNSDDDGQVMIHQFVELR
jgi:NADH:ubiquinone oxidoreductase subunit K